MTSDLWARVTSHLWASESPGGDAKYLDEGLQRPWLRQEERRRSFDPRPVDVKGDGEDVVEDETAEAVGGGGELRD